MLEEIEHSIPYHVTINLRAKSLDDDLHSQELTT